MGRAQMILLLCSPTRAQMMFSTRAVSTAMGVCVLLALQLGDAAAANVHLVNGDQCSGRVEWYDGYQWASVCDDGWDMKDAEVVCRELGCGDPVKAVTNPGYAYGEEPLFGLGSHVWLFRIECKGTENSLLHCREVFQKCDFKRQAGVICSGVASSGASPLPPSVYQRCPLNVTVPLGGAVTLSCLSGCNGTCVTGQGAAYCQLESGRAQLHIDAVAPEHAGDYNCSSDQTRLFTVDIHSDGCVSALQHEVVFVGDALQTLTTSSAIQCQLACTLHATCQLFSFQEEQENTPSICTLMTRDSTQHFSVNASVGTTSGFSLRNCPGTVMSPIRSYTLLQESGSWEEAQHRCSQSHTGLAVILSKQHLQYAQQALGGSTLSTWLGLHREAAGQQWGWTGMFQQWMPGYGGGPGCVFSYSGEWLTQSCDGSSGFLMCQYEYSDSGESVKVFRMVKKDMSWEAAEKFCRDTGGDLASILSQQEHTAFQEAARAAEAEQGYHIWIGLNRSDAALPWMWTNGKLPMGSAAADGQNCGVFNGTHWSPEDCSHKHTQFLCYQDGADATTTATTTTSTTTTTPAPETTSTTPAPVTTTTPAPVSTTTTTPAPESTSTTPAPESTTTTTTPAHESTTTTTSAPVSTTNNTPAPVSTATPMICNKSRCILGELVYVNSSVSWLEALDWCEQRGLRLLHILSNATQTQLNLLLSSLKPPYGPADIAWVGLIHCFLQPKETWEWLEGPLEHYEYWHPDSPRWRFGYHCGQVTKVGPGNYMWLDDCCSRKRPFVCQEVTDGRSKGTNPARGGRAPCYQRYT